MRRESYKEAFKNIEPDTYMEDRLLAKVRKSEHRLNPFKTAVSVALVLAFVLGGFYGIPQLKSIKGETNTADGNKSVLGSLQNKFTLVAYAAGNNSSKDGNAEKRLKTAINESKITLPFGKIKRGGYIEFTYTEGEKKGQVYRGYEGEFGGNICFDIEGKNIKSATFESTTGKFNFADFVKREELEKNGELYIAKFFLDESLFDKKGDRQSELTKLWDDGSLDKYKDMYFKGRSMNLHDYAVSFGQGASYDLTGKEIPGYEYVFDKKVEVPAHSVVITIAEKDAHEKWMQIDKSKITVLYNRGSNNFLIDWIPSKAFDRIREYAPFKYEELPGDTVIINVTFENGEVQTKKVDLSFDGEGNLVAQME